MSDIFSPVMKASSSRITSSVFQIITRSSKLDHSRALTRGEREDDRQIDRQETHHKHTDTKTHTEKKNGNKTKQNKIMVNRKKKNSHTAHTHGTRFGHRVPLYLPPDKYVTGLFPSEVIIVLQYYFVCIPNNHPELISGKGRRKEQHTHSWTCI